MHMEIIGMVAARAVMLKTSSLMLQRDLTSETNACSAAGSKHKIELDLQTGIPILTAQNESGRKKMLTRVSSLIFCPSLVDILLSITVLALKSCRVELATTTLLRNRSALLTHPVSQSHGFLPLLGEPDTENVQFGKGRGKLSNPRLKLSDRCVAM